MSVDNKYPSEEMRSSYAKNMGIVGAMFGANAGFLLHETVLKKMPQVKFRSTYTIIGCAILTGLIAKPVLTKAFPLPPTEAQDALLKA